MNSQNKIVSKNKASKNLNEHQDKRFRPTESDNATEEVLWIMNHVTT